MSLATTIFVKSQRKTLFLAGKLLMQQTGLAKLAAKKEQWQTHLEAGTVPPVIFGEARAFQAIGVKLNVFVLIIRTSFYKMTCNIRVSAGVLTHRQKETRTFFIFNSTYAVS